MYKNYSQEEKDYLNSLAYVIEVSEDGLSICEEFDPEKDYVCNKDISDSNGNINCPGCIDCRNCLNCKDCDACFRCNNCEYCYLCDGCAECKFGLYLDSSVNCSDCKYLARCSECVSCRNCELCVNCGLCKFCQGCKGIKDQKFKHGECRKEALFGDKLNEYAEKIEDWF